MEWKNYLYGLTHAFEAEPLKYPMTTMIDTYCFKLTKVFHEKVEIYPNIGFDLTESDFYTFYRVTACNVECDNGESIYRIGAYGRENYMDPTTYKDSATYKQGKIKMVYYPEKPYFDVPTKNNQIVWRVTGDQIKVVVHYEIIPIYPFLTRPSMNDYVDIEGFEEYYESLIKNPYSVIIEIRIDYFGEGNIAKYKIKHEEDKDFVKALEIIKNSDNENDMGLLMACVIYVKSRMVKKL